MIFCILTCGANRVTHRCGVRASKGVRSWGTTGERRRHREEGCGRECMSRATTARHRCGARASTGGRSPTSALAAWFEFGIRGSPSATGAKQHKRAFASQRPAVQASWPGAACWGQNALAPRPAAIFQRLIAFANVSNHATARRRGCAERPRASVAERTTLQWRCQTRRTDDNWVAAGSWDRAHPSRKGKNCVRCKGPGSRGHPSPDHSNQSQHACAEIPHLCRVCHL